MTEDELSARLKRTDSGELAGTLPVGTCFGDWRLTAFIARGGNSDVYCGEHVTLGTAAAIKVLRDEGHAERCERFRNEARLLSELKSASFPRFYAYGTSDGRDYLVEELLEPRELPHTRRSGIRFLYALCDAIGELHRRGIVHCDIKPANILFRRGSYEPVLVDLGLAVSISDDPSGGSRGYSAPEQFLGGAITPAADIHALGVLAERMNLGFRGIIRRATSSIPSERFESAADFARAIRYRVWARYVVVALSALIVIACGVKIVMGNMVTPAPIEIELHGQRVVRTEPLHIKAGQVVRIIGPGWFDAAITGEKGSRLWMTNCFVLNRAQKIYPKDPLYYELTKDVYLNFCNSDKPSCDEMEIGRRFSSYDQNSKNEVRYRGSESWSDLTQERNSEYYLRLQRRK